MSAKRKTVGEFNQQTSSQKVVYTYSTNEGGENVNVSNEKVGAPWIVIIPLLIFFFPVGAPLLISRLHKEKSCFERNGKTAMIVGGIYVAMGILGFPTTSYEGSKESMQQTAIVAVGLLVFGIVLLVQGKKYRKLGLLRKKYLDMIRIGNITDVDHLADSCGIGSDTVVSDLQSMIDDGILAGYHIDLQKRQLVSIHEKMSDEISSFFSQADSIVNEEKSVKCPNCGGMNTIKAGGENVCEYCGSPLN